MIPIWWYTRHWFPCDLWKQQEIHGFMEIDFMEIRSERGHLMYFDGE